MSINNKKGDLQEQWTQDKWEQEQIFTGLADEYGVAYKFRKSNIRLKKNRNYLLIALMLAFVGVGVYFSGDYMVKNVFNSTPSGVVSAPAINYYALQSGEYSTIEEATMYSQRVRELGGAGYVYKKDLSYKVLVSVYENEKDANSVLEKILPSLPDSKVVTLKSPQIVMDYNIEDADKECLQDALNLFHSVFTKLYSISVSYDLGETTFAMAQLSMVELQKEFESVYVPYSSVFSNSRDVRIASLTFKLSVMQDELDKLADPMALEENFDINIKYSIISVCLARAYI